LPADLPLLTVEDLRHLHHLAATGRGLVIAPSRGGGTSALLLRPPHAIPFAFGPASFAQHCRLAAEHGYGCVVYESPTLAFDVDTPADWAELQQTR
jgi:2-phospho-L-lactate/phosphoenolpyruvate guanylyltransferase